MESRTVLRVVFGTILVSLLVCTSWAGLHQPVWQWGGLTQPPDNGWTIATLLDAYCGFITFFVWVVYKEQSALKRLLWFIAIMALGNMAMSFYVLRELARLAPGEPTSDLLTRRNA
jgi:hypothetical protein